MTSACVALFTSALVAGAATSCGQIFGLPDGTLDEGGDGSSDASPGSEAGTDGQADGGASGGDAGARRDAGDGTASSDGAMSGDGSSGEAGSADAAGDAGEGGGNDDCAPAALSLYAEDEFAVLFRADFSDKTFKKVVDTDCITGGDPQHLAITRAGHGWLLGEDRKIHDLNLMTGTCSGLGTVDGGENFDDMSITFARPGGATTDRLYTCSPEGLGTIDSTTFAWSLISELSGIDHSLGCTIKPGRNGSLAILASTNASGPPANFTLYEVDAANGSILTNKDFGTAIYDNGDDNDGFDFAWSNSLYYIYAATMDNESYTYTYDPASGAIETLFDFPGYTFATAAQSTCAP